MIILYYHVNLLLMKMQSESESLILTQNSETREFFLNRTEFEKHQDIEKVRFGSIRFDLPSFS